MEIVREDNKDGAASYAIYVVDTSAGRVKLVGGISHFLALNLALAQRRDYGAIIDRTRG